MGICNDDRIIHDENDKVLNKDSDISETFNNHFVNITKDLGIFHWADDSSDRLNIFTRISSFSNHPSVQMIKDKYQNSFNFKFELVSTDQVINLLMKLIVTKVQVEIYQQKLLRLPKKKLQNQ